MQVSQRTFNMTAIVLAIAAVMLMPFWHFGTWGYMPSALVIGCVIMMLVFRKLQES